MILEFLRVITGLILILFIPGFALTLAFYPQKDDIRNYERIALSLVLSISGTILSVLFADLVMGIDNTPVNILLTIFSLTFLAIMAWGLHLFTINKENKEKVFKRILGLLNRKKG